MERVNEMTLSDDEVEVVNDPSTSNTHPDSSSCSIISGRTCSKEHNLKGKQYAHPDGKFFDNIEYSDMENLAGGKSINDAVVDFWLSW